ncbi:MAG: type II toxin-antitoxin system RelE/ParE family toxin [Pirellulales bacterium]
MSRKTSAKLLLTGRALDDLAGIVEFSTREWGDRVATRYLDDIEAGIRRLCERPGLLEPLADLPSALKCYAVNKHVIVCDVQGRSIVVLTIIHASMDIPRRLAELQPSIAAEVVLLHESLRRRR